MVATAQTHTMPDFCRYYVPGGTYFFTVVTADRRPILMVPGALPALKAAFAEVAGRWPFVLDALVILPNHLHAMWTLPDGDSDFSRRWAVIKKTFTKARLADGAGEAGRTPAQIRERRRGIWQRRFWEHLVRDEEDWRQHLNYIHYNPVWHELVAAPVDWRQSTFRRWVRAGVYDRDWGRSDGPAIRFDGLDLDAIE